MTGCPILVAVSTLLDSGIKPSSSSPSSSLMSSTRSMSSLAARSASVVGVVVDIAVCCDIVYDSVRIVSVMSDYKKLYINTEVISVAVLIIACA
jgi:hypothetical protein